MTWPVEREGHDYLPLPETWLDHPHARDPPQHGPRCLAVSCEIQGGRILRVRYAHLVSGNVVETFGTATQNPDGDGYVPLGLVDGTGWPRSFVPSPGEPHDTIRAYEREHLRALWADRLSDLQFRYESETLDVDPDEQLVTDGGQAISTENAAARKTQGRGSRVLGGLWGMCHRTWSKKRLCKKAGENR